MAALILSQRHIIGLAAVMAAGIALAACVGFALSICIDRVEFLKANADYPLLFGLLLSLERIAAFLVHAPLLPRQYRRNVRNFIGGAQGPYSTPDSLTEHAIRLFKEAERVLLERLAINDMGASEE